MSDSVVQSVGWAKIAVEEPLASERVTSIQRQAGRRTPFHSVEPSRDVITVGGVQRAPHARPGPARAVGRYGMGQECP